VVLDIPFLLDDRISVIIQKFCHWIMVWSQSRTFFGVHAPLPGSRHEPTSQSMWKQLFGHGISDIYSDGFVFSPSHSNMQRSCLVTNMVEILHCALATACRSVTCCYFHCLLSLGFELWVWLIKGGGLRSAVISIVDPCILSFQSDILFALLVIKYVLQNVMRFWQLFLSTPYV
jgi:hypothetical protein